MSRNLLLLFLNLHSIGLSQSSSQVCKRRSFISFVSSVGAGIFARSVSAVHQMSERTPAAYVPHGGGPLPILGEESHLELAAWLKSFAATYLTKPPKTILVISAHWEENVPTLLSSPAPPLYYDYGGFPAETYKLNYPAQNNLTLVERISGLLKSSNIDHKMDSSRGYDHGVFIPLLLMFPNANIPVVQISLIKNFDPMAHYELGRALSPLRNEGVLIIGSGMSFHNMRGFSDSGNKHSEPFHAYLNQALLYDDPETKLKKIMNWTQAPDARKCHPREEHLMPLMVVLGAAGTDAKVLEAFNGKVINVKCSGYVFE